MDEVHKWHLQRGIQSPSGTKTGYHLMINRDSHVMRGRHPLEIGAHARGINQYSMSVCLWGGSNEWGLGSRTEDNFTDDQYESLNTLLTTWYAVWPDIVVIGHNQWWPDKDCPSFDVPAFLLAQGFTTEADPVHDRASILSLIKGDDHS